MLSGIVLRLADLFSPIFKPSIIVDWQEYHKVFNCISQMVAWRLWVVSNEAV